MKIVPAAIFSGLGAILFYMYRDSCPLIDVGFALGYLAYIHLANFVCFNSNRLQLLQRKEPLDMMRKHSLGKGIFIDQPAFKSYMAICQLLCVFFPLVLLFAGPSELVGPIASPIILLFAQCFGESTTNSFHDVLRILVPIGFNAYRLGPLLTWFRHSLDQYHQFASSSSSDGNTIMYISLNLMLGAINLAFWSYNLFVFLLLRVLPVYFDRVDTPLVEMKYTMIPIPKPKAKAKY